MMEQRISYTETASVLGRKKIIIIERNGEL